MPSRTLWLLLLASTLAAGCAGTRPSRTAASADEVGLASYYTRAETSSRTASGAPMDDDALAAAHRTLPFGTRVRVTNLSNDQSVVVTINDRGPFRRNRVIDVTRRAAEALGFVRAGIARVRVEVVRR